MFPAWVQAVAGVLPLTHGLRAIRGVLAGSGGRVAQDATLQAAVAMGWFLVAAASFRWFAEGGRTDGSLEFGS